MVFIRLDDHFKGFDSLSTLLTVDDKQEELVVRSAGMTSAPRFARKYLFWSNNTLLIMENLRPF